MSRTVQLSRSALRGLALTALLGAALFGTAMADKGGRPGPAVEAGALGPANTPGADIGWDSAPLDEAV
ncbi:hypothetical protein [Streptomyces sp. NPDC006134]|uniref:hypothetical protein n=1 Tax=Streptomyces sp. NPDC006134 TaxID=3154467 RepID=UPI0033ED2AEE